MKKKTDYHHHNLKEVLVLKSLELLDEKPYEKITVRELTDALNVSRTAIYRHFDSKEALFHAVILKGFEQLFEVMEPIYRDTSKDIHTKFFDIGQAYIDFALASPARYRLMVGDKLMALREENCNLTDDSLDGAFMIIVSLVKEAQEKKIFQQADVNQQAITIWALIHGQASLLIDGHPMIRAYHDSTYNIAFDMMMKGL